ncbi:MAG TPA: response regulator [Chitinophagaceae bacterium]|nr:response regulator [Chitinophagaceae bacterium]
MEITQLNLLLGDDDKDDCLFFNEAISELPYSIQLTTVYNGDQVIQWLTSGKNTLPHILFLDLNLPRRNGYECLSQVKQIEVLKSLPVIIISTSFIQKMADQLYNNGAHFYIRKPTEFSKLKTLIHQAIILSLKNNFIQPPLKYYLLTGDLNAYSYTD